MLRESNQTAEKIIELIHTLPEKEQKLIASKLSMSSTQKKTKASKKNDDHLKKIERFQKYVGKHRFALPKDYKFDREEANAR